MVQQREAEVTLCAAASSTARREGKALDSQCPAQARSARDPRHDPEPRSVTVKAGGGARSAQSPASAARPPGPARPGPRLRVRWQPGSGGSGLRAGPAASSSRSSSGGGAAGGRIAAGGCNRRGETAPGPGSVRRVPRSVSPRPGPAPRPPPRPRPLERVSRAPRCSQPGRVSRRRVPRGGGEGRAEPSRAGSTRFIAGCRRSRPPGR